MTLDLSQLSAREQIASIYIGYYDRAADPFGSNFWEAVLANPSLDLTDIADDFATQAETLIAYPFLDDPTEEEAGAFIAEVYLNLFNRAPDQAGIDFWAPIVVDAVNGVEGALSVGEIILAIIEGAQDVPGGTQDRTTILNKIEVAVSWTDEAEASGLTGEDDYPNDALAQQSAKSIIEPVTDDPATVSDAKQTIDDFFEPAPVPGDTILLTSATDVLTGSDADDEFNAYIQQNPFAGGVSNSLSSADRLDGGAGIDSLYAELAFELFGTSQLGVTDIQPRTQSIEKIQLEARDFNEGYDGSTPFDIDDEWSDDDIPLVFDAKKMTDVEEIGSYYSDGDLIIENLTTLTKTGDVRNTDAITITMDHTDNSNTDNDSADLKVYFDDDYLLSGQESKGQIFYFLLDEDAELVGNPNRLNNIDVDGIRFDITNADGSVTSVNIESPEANVAGTHQGFVNALQAPLQALIADGTLPAGTTLVLDPTITDTTFLDDGSESDDIPAIVLTSGDGSFVEATGFSRIAEEIGEYDVYGRFASENEVEDQPITVNIELHKVGRGGEGGELIIGGKADSDGNSSTEDGNTLDPIADGIEVFRITVIGDEFKPNVVDRITSTGDELAQVYISTDAASALGETFASLEVENGFSESGSSESGDLELINADGFLGRLILGSDTDIHNADTITAQGGGDVTLYLDYDGSEIEQAYNVTTGGGDDWIEADLSGDALDYVGSSLSVSTGGGDDYVEISFEAGEDSSFSGGSEDNEQLNQAVLDNVTVDTGANDDVVSLDGVGNAYIMTGTGNDVIYSGDDSGSRAEWAFNFDAARVTATNGSTVSGYTEDELPGVQDSLAYIGGATVKVILSGANGGSSPGGGVMADGVAPNGAWPGDNGYESAAIEINDLSNGNQFYGTQTDINEAVMEAINDDPILSNLLEVRMGPNNTLIVESLTAGQFGIGDLRIEIEQDDRDDWTAVEAEAQALFGDSDITITTLADANDYGNSLESTTETDAWYDGLSLAEDPYVDGVSLQGTQENVTNRLSSGSDSDEETDTVINGGDGDDLIVLSTDSADSFIADFTVSSNNALINGASNETVVMTGPNFGDDTVMNFQTAGGAEHTSDTSEFAPGSDPLEGLDFLDFTAYLTSQFDASPDGGSPEGSSDSYNTIATTLETVASDVGANEVAIVTFDVDSSDDDETFAALNAADIAALFNDSVVDDDDDKAYGTLTETGFEVQFGLDGDTVVGGDGKAIVMVENGDNDGEYKVFELSWDAGGNDTDDNVAVNYLGSLDFGDSLEGLTEVNLVGSTQYSNLLTTGFDLSNN